MTAHGRLLEYIKAFVFNIPTSITDSDSDRVEYQNALSAKLNGNNVMSGQPDITLFYYQSVPFMMVSLDDELISLSEIPKNVWRDLKMKIELFNNSRELLAGAILDLSNL